jgi:hypothetical protein
VLTALERDIAVPPSWHGQIVVEGDDVAEPPRVW